MEQINNRKYLLPSFNKDGFLPPGEHQIASWQEFVDRFGKTEKRLRLIEGMKMALLNLQGAGCRRVYINGSFVTEKLEPSDYDGYWDVQDVDPNKLDEVLFGLNLDGCEKQKSKYGGELLVKGMRAMDGKLIEEYYKRNTPGAIEKGIVIINLQSITLEL